LGNSKHEGKISSGKLLASKGLDGARKASKGGFSKNFIGMDGGKAALSKLDQAIRPKKKNADKENLNFGDKASQGSMFIQRNKSKPTKERRTCEKNPSVSQDRVDHGPNRSSLSPNIIATRRINPTLKLNAGSQGQPSNINS
jgi:hypothetical protein